MDKHLVEKVTRIVMETLGELEVENKLSNHNTVKIWPHQSPLPAPIMMTSIDSKEPRNEEKMITISPYV